MQARRHPGQVLVDKLAACMPPGATLTEKEETALLRLGSVTRPVRRGAEIIVQGHSCDCLFFLVNGFALRYKIMPDGRRQVLNVSLAGDLIGFPACFFRPALNREALVALADFNDAYLTRAPAARGMLQLEHASTATPLNGNGHDRSAEFGM